jgi:hypothetical protein
VHWDVGFRLLMLSDVVCVAGGRCQRERIFYLLIVLFQWIIF